MIISPIVADFTSEDHYEVTGRGSVYIVRNPREIHSSEGWSWLINKWVRLDGRIVLVTGVESYAIHGIYAAGRPIGILVKEVENQDTTP